MKTWKIHCWKNGNVWSFSRSTFATTHLNPLENFLKRITHNFTIRISRNIGIRNRLFSVENAYFFATNHVRCSKSCVQCAILYTFGRLTSEPEPHTHEYNGCKVEAPKIPISHKIQNFMSAKQLKPRFYSLSIGSLHGIFVTVVDTSFIQFRLLFGKKLTVPLFNSWFSILRWKLEIRKVVASRLCTNVVFPNNAHTFYYSVFCIFNVFNSFSEIYSWDWTLKLWIFEPKHQFLFKRNTKRTHTRHSHNCIRTFK